jgi:hypothetical protein
MRHLTAIILGMALAALSLGVVLAAETVELVSVWNPSGALPDGCSPALTGGGRPPKWVNVEADNGEARGVSEVSRDDTDYRFPLCIVDDPAFASLANLVTSIRFRAVAGKVDQAAGIAIRVKDARNYYVVRANALEDNVRLYVVLDGDRRQFAGKSIKVASGQWHSLRLRAVGERFTVFFDGAQMFEATDRRLSGPGRIALWSKADSVSEFFDFKVEPLP